MSFTELLMFIVCLWMNCTCLLYVFDWTVHVYCMSLTELYMFIVCLWLNCTCLLYVFDWTVHVYCMSLTELFMFIVCLWLNWSCLLHVKWEMSNLYDMYIVHMLPVKEKKNFYKEDKSVKDIQYKWTVQTNTYNKHVQFSQRHTINMYSSVKDMQ
jgi:hypothetical protein